MIFKKTTIASLISLSAFASSLQAEQFTVNIENLTNGMYFTPLLVAAHDESTQLFATGTEANASLKAMAEGGDISELVADIADSAPTTVENPAAGLLAPGANITTSILNTDDTVNTKLSIVAMMLPTNDGFVGLDSWAIPTIPGTYSFTVNAYDAGTEANDELSANIPQPPVDFGVGTGGTGVSNSDSNTMIHIHRGSIGDSDATGGISDLDNQVHRWLNPVARITIVIN